MNDQAEQVEAKHREKVMRIADNMLASGQEQTFVMAYVYGQLSIPHSLARTSDQLNNCEELQALNSYLTAINATWEKANA